ncbi:hypothetical protein AKO1_014398 [Acrasis kona]|uniref:Uncharacterized protein n=1 Tax=Acrasis kona TaxID=1008807 RepID=A0AAW2YZD3_9EUKA
MTDRAAYYDFFNKAPVNKSSAESNALVEKFHSKLQIPLSTLKQYFEFFYKAPVNKTVSESLDLIEKFHSRLPVAYVKDAFDFFYKSPVNKTSSESIDLVYKWGTHPYGSVPIFFMKVMFDFFYKAPVNKNASEALSLVYKYYETTEVDGWLPSYDKLVYDIPKFFDYFYKTINCNSSESLVNCERIMKGVGKVDFDTFSKAYDHAYRKQNQNRQQSMAAAFSAVGL